MSDINFDNILNEANFCTSSCHPRIKIFLSIKDEFAYKYNKVLLLPPTSETITLAEDQCQGIELIGYMIVLKIGLRTYSIYTADEDYMVYKLTND